MLKERLQELFRQAHYAGLLRLESDESTDLVISQILELFEKEG